MVAGHFSHIYTVLPEDIKIEILAAGAPLPVEHFLMALLLPLLRMNILQDIIFLMFAVTGEMFGSKKSLKKSVSFFG